MRSKSLAINAVYQQTDQNSMGTSSKPVIFIEMRLFHKLEELPSFPEGTALTIGNFDGLHVGHRALVSKILEASKGSSLKSLVVTFHPHPMQVLYPEKGLKRLFDLKDTFEELKALGLDGLFAIPFSREFSQLSPQEFFFKYVFKPLNPKFLVVGHDFNFGADRKGSFETLRQLAESHGVKVEKIAPITVGEGPVSSSRLRSLLAQGDVASMQMLLGRVFYIRGVVEKGYARGRQLGFPTANLRSFSESLPASGVYITRVWVGGKAHWAVTNVGVNPTFKGGSEFSPVKVESHLLNFAGDLYGVELKIEFHQHLRNEKKFQSVEDLRTQIEKDVDEAREWIKAKS